MSAGGVVRGDLGEDTAESPDRNRPAPGGASPAVEALRRTMSDALLVYYCALIAAVSVLGGLLPKWLRMTHRWTEVAVSFVAGTMLGVALLHLLPHALMAGSAEGHSLAVYRWVLVGFLAMFFIERSFCFHHHDVPEEAGDTNPETTGEAAPAAPDTPLHVCSEHDHPHTDHSPGLNWGGAAMGLTLHSVLAGVALGASVRHAQPEAGLAGFGAFLAIVLHKPLDAMTIAMLMANTLHSARLRQGVAS